MHMIVHVFKLTTSVMQLPWRHFFPVRQQLFNSGRLVQGAADLNLSHVCVSHKKFKC